MGVLACDRYGCDNVMCDRLSTHHGYICDECFDELVSKGASTDIDQFMASEKDRSFDTDAVRTLFNSVFPFQDRGM